MICLLLTVSIMLVSFQVGVQTAPATSTSNVFVKKSNTSSFEPLADPTAPLEVPSISESDAATLLDNLGYKDSIGMRFGDSDESLDELILHFQRDNDLTETGTLDDETKFAMGRPRCGWKKSARMSGDVLKWRKKSITYRINNLPRGKRSAPVKAALAKAFGEWSKITNLDFSEVSSGRQADILISFDKRVHELEGQTCIFDDPRTLAHAFFPEIGDIHFNSNYYFDGGASLDEFLDTALHEIGHSLGLEHINSRASLMHPTQTSQFDKPQPIDIQRIQTLYGARRGRSTTVNKEPTENLSEGIDAASTNNSPPDLCSLSKIDAAVDDTEGNVYILSGDHYFVLNSGNPAASIASKWPGLPGNIDAAFRFKDGRTYFFKKDKFWRFKGNRMDAGYPRSISAGFPGVPNNIDAILIDGSGDIFAFKGGMLWVYDPSHRQVKSTISIAMAAGLPSNIDAALDTDTSVIVFKGNAYYVLQDGFFQKKNHSWFQCGRRSYFG